MAVDTRCVLSREDLVVHGPQWPEKALEFIQRKLNGLEIWDEPSIDSALADTQAALDLPTPKLNQPIRIAMTGSTQSPSLGLTLCLFGKAESNARIQNALDHLKESPS